MDSPENRYRYDPEFHVLVDLLDNMISRAQYTPSELREAALLAAIHYESRTVRLQFSPPADAEGVTPPTNE